jgi:Tfp pilus assembly protein PilV
LRNSVSSTLYSVAVKQIPSSLNLLEGMRHNPLIFSKWASQKKLFWRVKPLLSCCP